MYFLLKIGIFHSYVSLPGGTFIFHRADVSLDMSEKCQLLPERIPSFFEQNVLKAVGRTQEGGCKVNVGKTSWKPHLKAVPLEPCKQEVRST